MDAIDFPCSPVWVRHYAARGLTADYPAALACQPARAEPPPSPVPDPMRSLQQYKRFYHLDVDGMDADAIRRELRHVLRLEDEDDWFVERALRLRAGLHQSRGESPEPTHVEPAVPKPQRKGIEL